MSSPVLAEVVRSGFVEGRHRGSVVALAPDGSVEWALGDPDAPMLPRSCLKPLQAVAMLRHGLPLEGELLAIACASHSGEELHLDAVRRVLAGAGLGEDALGNTEDWPFDREERDAWVRGGRTPSRIGMNCSGKHAAMLATCVVNDWPLDGYLHPDHPLQQAVREAVEELTGIVVDTVLVDGCGAPLLPTTLTGLAHAFQALAVAGTGPERAVADAIRTHPELVSGTRRDEAALLRAVPGAIAKLGAEACYVVALPDGRAVACKVEDGSDRARPVVMAAALQRLGVDELPGVDAEALAATGRSLLYGGGEPVGAVQPAF